MSRAKAKPSITRENLAYVGEAARALHVLTSAAAKLRCPPADAAAPPASSPTVTGAREMLIADSAALAIEVLQLVNGLRAKLNGSGA